MRKCKLLILCCIMLCAGVLTGCGGEYAGLTEGDAVSGSAVSGEAVSGDAIKENAVSGSAVENRDGKMSRKEAGQDMSRHRFCTDTNLYYVSENEEKLMQARGDGTHGKCIREWPLKKNEEIMVEVVYADENWLYYDVNFDWEYEVTYRAPIEKDAKGQDVVQFSKEEELVRDELLIPRYADSDYYFYEDYDDNVVKYDLKRKEKVSETNLMGEIFRVKGHYVMADENMIYSQKTDSGQWEELSDYTGWSSDVWMIAQRDEEEIFYPRYVTIGKLDLRIEIMRYDGTQVQNFVTWEQLDHAAKEATGVEKLDVCRLNNIFWQEGRLYLQMQTGWMEGKTYHMGYMIFSKGEKEGASGLRYEKELTECMKSYVKERSGKWTDIDEDAPEDGETVFVEHMLVNEAQCIAMAEGNAYLSLFDYDKDKGRVACYDLFTGKFQWISKKDPEFHMLKYDYADWSDFANAYENYDYNDFVEAWEYPPSADKEGDGWFVEDN
ncbi:MAG: hypothetical protein NC293_04545 [Roseburia sp.]|nr:hypothetical protein [Roseburia sp.]